MKRIIAIPVVITAWLIASGSPAHAQNREHQQMAAELRIMQERSQETAIALDRALAQLKDLSQLIDAFKAMNTRLQTLDESMRKSLADQKVSLDAMNTELRVIKERAHDTNTRIGTLAEEVDALSTAVSMSAAAAAAAPPAVDGGEPVTDALGALSGVTSPVPSTPAPAVARSGLTPKRLYDTAWADYTSGNYDRAVEGFQRYLAEFPKYADADDAQFYIAESHMRMKRTPEAVAAYTTVVQNYPSADMVPAAYYGLGEAQRQLGQIEAARTSWETVATKYPDSDGGILASQRLVGLPPRPAPRQP